ncbi:MAG: hypothetical protein QM703_28160 [Gemmatales bacterium]
MMLPRIGIIAGHGVDAAVWREHTQLPATYDWRIIETTSSVSPHDLSGFVWLWKPSLPVEQHNAERVGLQEWVRSILGHRENHLIPIVLAAVEPLSELNEEAKEQALGWLKSVQAMLKKTYHKELQGWVPAALTDQSRVMLQADRPDSGQHLADAITRLRTTIVHWQARIRRQAERCLAVGLMLIGLYVTLLLMTIPWKPREQVTARTMNPVSWTHQEWNYHLKDCRNLLTSVEGRPFEKLTPAEQARFTEHLRWLPISLDWLQQKRATREVIRLRSQVSELLSVMEGMVEAWTTTPAASLVEQVALQATSRQLLDGVFEPRPPPTTLHQAAKRYWVNERAITVQLLKGILSQKTALPIRLAEVNTALLKSIEQAESCRVHAPELKNAWLQELNTSQAWLEKLLAKPAVSISIEELRKEDTPTLLREAAKVE